MNIVQLNNFIEKIVSCTEIVKSFYTNSVYECWNTEEVKYGSISFCITKTQMRERTMTYDAIIYYGDRLLEDKSNRNAIWSDATQVIQSIIGTVNSVDGEITISYPYNLTLFEQKFADELAGAYAEISIEVEGVGECGDLLYGYEDGEGVKLESVVKTFTINGEYDIIPSDGFDAISDVKVIVDVPMQSKSVTYNEVGDYQVTPDPGYEALSKVDIKVSLEGKIEIPNGLRFTGGDMGLVEWDKYDWSMVYDTTDFFKGCSSSDPNWFERFKSGFNGKLLSGYNMFMNFNSNQSIDFTGIDTSQMVTGWQMFYSSKFTNIRGLNFSNMLNAYYMFGNCNFLESIDIINTHNILDMSNMFYNCTSLRSLPQLDTSKVTSMSGAFSNCKSLKSIPYFNTSNVTIMDNTFQYCEKITTIPQLDTSKVESMTGMFFYCQSLQTIPQLNTSKVTSMRSMFSYCKSLTTVPELDISSTTSITDMFLDCTSLVEVRFKGNPSKLGQYTVFSGVNTSGVFYYDSRYDYSKIISVLPSTWTAVPYDVID